MSLAKANFISQYRGAVIELLTALEKLQALKTRYDALGYSEALKDGDFVDANSGLTMAELSSAVYSVSELQSAIEKGHLTNLYKLVI